jgi:hypothetical protein
MNDAQFEELRAELYGSSAEIVDEMQLEELLRDVLARAREDLYDQFGVERATGPSWRDRLGLPRADNLNPERAERMLASVEAWASIASHLTIEAYVGPLREVGAVRQRVVGWSRSVVARLTDLADLLAGYLQKAMHKLKASSFTISVGFPVGVSVGLSWG